MTPATQLLRRAWWSLVIFSLAGGMAGAAVTAKSRPGVDVVQTFTVPVPSLPARVPGTEREQEAPFDALQSSELFADTLAGWLTSPDFVAASFRRANLTFPRASVRRLSRAFTSIKRGGSVVEVRFRAPSADEGRGLARAVAEEIRTRVQGFNAATRGLAFQVRPSEPLVIPIVWSPPLRGATAAIVLFVVGLNALLLWDFLRSSPAD